MNERLGNKSSEMLTESQREQIERALHAAVLETITLIHKGGPLVSGNGRLNPNYQQKSKGMTPKVRAAFWEAYDRGSR